MMTRPTIAGIERTTAITGVAAAALLYIFVSSPAALGCVAGSAFMIVNFFLLALVGGGIIAMASGAKGFSMLAILLIPLKLAFFLGAAYVIVSVLHVNIPGFVAGVLTQFAAIFIETWRTSDVQGKVVPM
jgi:hypothetical protein